MPHLLARYFIWKQFGGGEKKKWSTLSHNGVLFPPEYEPHGIPVVYNGTDVFLEPEAEECATLYAKYLESEYIKEKIFNKNFWKDWKKVLGEGHLIENFEGCDFSGIYEFLLEKKKEKQEMSKEEKIAQKEERTRDEMKYKVALVDGKEQPVGNFRIEPPGIFLGRGCNPKLGRIKRRIYPEDVTINIGADSVIPEPLEGHKWGDVIHDDTVEWLASWKDEITGKMKYVWLGAQSELKGKNDADKFDLARKLKKNVGRIREMNDINLTSNDEKIMQIATALYFIDNFALRVGNEKGEDEADTVGVVSLRVEHIELLEGGKIGLDFLGKDSVRYNNTVVVSEQVYKNVSELITGKDKFDNLFDKIVPSDLNKYLQSFMNKLTAKVFRTYNASNLFQKELKKIDKKFSEMADSTDKINMLLDEYNKANAKVALLCNHQKNVNKSSNKQIDRINERIKKLKAKLRKAKSTKADPEKINKIKSDINKWKVKKQLKIELKNISLGTSKINYIDPRITVAFIKKHNLPVDKLFSKNLQDKFHWAFDVDADYRF